jgi:hypothetical protein
LKFAKINDCRSNENLKRKIRISLEEILNFLGIENTKPNRDIMRPRIHAAFKLMMDIKLSWTEKIGKAPCEFRRYVFGGVALGRNGIFEAEFNHGFAEHLNQSYITALRRKAPGFSHGDTRRSIQADAGGLNAERA